MSQTIIQVGNSKGVLLPKKIIAKLGLKKGSKVNMEVTPDKRVIISKKGTKSQKTSSVTPEFLKWLDAFNKEYGSALKELANK